MQLDNDLNVKPSVAKNWHISNNSLVYTFSLRDDVFFHDDKLFKNGKGRGVIAKDFEYSFNRLLDKKLAAPGAWVLSNVSSFKAENDSIFIIELTTPFPAFLSRLLVQVVRSVPPPVWLAQRFLFFPQRPSIPPHFSRWSSS